MSGSAATRIDVDVLVVGGGFAGGFAALRAAEKRCDVLLLDKAYVSRSGASAVSGGVTTAPTSQDDLEKWVEELAVFGGYEADQDWTRVLLNDQMERIRELDGWGVPIERTKQGSFKRIKSRGMVHVRVLQFSPRHAIERLREETLRAGVRIMDRIQVTELLTSDGVMPTAGRVVGAVGFDVRSGQAYVIRAKNVILATGPLALKGFHPVDNLTGDGFAMGYRVGAKFIDTEFAAGGTFEFLWGRLWMGGYNIAVGHGARLRNAHGESFMDRYDPERKERTESNRVIAAFLKELIEGRGPVFLDLTGVDPAYWPALERARGGRPSVLLSGAIPDPRLHQVPIEAAWTLWNGGKGGLHIDLWCRTSVPGLYAVGGVARNSGVGRHGSAGTPTAMAMVSGARAGIAAADEAMLSELPELAEDQVDKLLHQMRRPMESGDLAVVDLMHRQISEVMGSAIDVMVMNEQRIADHLARVRELREQWATWRVPDLHELVKYHEAQNTLDSLELIFTCMSDRTESRESFYRDDFPMSDDYEWLCWHTARRAPNGIVCEKEPIPFDLYRYRPPPPQRTMSPIGAIMSGAFEPTDVAEPLRGAAIGE